MPLPDCSDPKLARTWIHGVAEDGVIDDIHRDDLKVILRLRGREEVNVVLYITYPTAS